MQAPLERSVVLSPGEGEELLVGGARISLKVASRDTRGRFSLAEYELPARYGGLAPHVHASFEHAWYVTLGRVRVEIQGRTSDVGPGGFVYVRRGEAHTIANPFDEPARVVAVDTPGGLEVFYRAVARASEQGEVPQEVFEAIERRFDTREATGG